MSAQAGRVTQGQSIEPLAKRKSWKALEEHSEEIRKVHLRVLFADDPKRGERLTAEGVGVFLDYSKNLASDQSIKHLLHLAEESGLAEIAHRDHEFVDIFQKASHVKGKSWRWAAAQCDLLA